MNRKTVFLLLLFMCCVNTAVSAAPDFREQLELIASQTYLWAPDYDPYIQWGYIVADLDQNGRQEIISASLQGTGMYTTFDIFEVSEDGSSLKKVEQDRPEYDSAPDIMVSRIDRYYDEKDDRYSYVFTDMIRNGYAEYYENKRAVWLEDGIWKETPLVFMSVICTDPDHCTESFSDASEEEISAEAYENAAAIYFENIEPAEICLNWQMTDREVFSKMDRAALLASLGASASPVCPEK